jgi:cysteine desulfurase
MMNIRAGEINADLISLSAHKFHGSKGTGALYIRKGTKLESLIHGGSQERGLRAGTENVPGIVGMGKAITIAVKEREENTRRIRALRDQMITTVLEKIPGAQLNGHPEKRLANNCHFSFAGIESEALLLRLDLAGISVSGGSACTSGSMEPSHVLQAIGLKDEMLKSGIRMTMGRETTREEIEKTAEKMSEIIADLRQMRVIHPSSI